jgi:DNA-binding transcriptional LysR family regulator
MENFRLKVFRVVARHMNFTRAAEELLLTQPAVTQQIKALEDEYGVPLFDRSGGRIALTAAGAALLPYAEQLKARGARREGWHWGRRKRLGSTCFRILWRDFCGSIRAWR